MSEWQNMNSNPGLPDWRLTLLTTEHLSGCSELDERTCIHLILECSRAHCDGFPFTSSSAETPPGRARLPEAPAWLWPPTPGLPLPGTRCHLDGHTGSSVLADMEPMHVAGPFPASLRTAGSAPGHWKVLSHEALHRGV